MISDANNQKYAGEGGVEGMHILVPVLSVIAAVVSLLFGCTWCYNHKSCKVSLSSLIFILSMTFNMLQFHRY